MDYNRVAMKAFILLFFTMSLTLSAQAESKWRLIRDEDNIQVYSRHSSGTVIQSVKGVVNISTSMDKLLNIFEDITKCPNWMYRCKRAKTLKQINIVERIDYIVTDLPWPTWDRDLIIHSVFQQNRKTKQVEIKFRSLLRYVAVKPGIVRIEKMKGAMRFVPQKNGSIQFTYEINADPRGNISKWMVNAMATDFPFYTLKKIRTLAEK
ncbi:MAG: START domain-containing protein [Cocleimonas sp.]|nr:START domain-containing protein [Cocleimonas sp.]